MTKMPSDIGSLTWNLDCNHCGKPAVWTANKAIYGVNYGRSYMIWWCKDCDAFVGCHGNTREPLGRFLAKKDLRDARKAAHRLVDSVWKSGKKHRSEVYVDLQRAFGRPIHIGDTETPWECWEIMNMARKIFNIA